MLKSNSLDCFIELGFIYEYCFNFFYEKNEITQNFNKK